MQIASEAFDKAISKPNRNRGYIKVSIGVVNSDAQNNAEVVSENLAYFSDAKKPFDGYDVTKVYATAEEDFTKVDGTMYFLPGEDDGYTLYNNGIVTDEMLGIIRVEFGGATGLDIKGLTIDFGDVYPTKFIIESDSGRKAYENDKRLFTTEDAFDGTSFFLIRPLEMSNGQNRLRINRFTCGIANTFSNEKVQSCSTKEYVSPISETIPSMDTTLVVDNHDLYYSADNPESAIAYMEVGQEVKVTFGYDVTGSGDIEWLNETTTYLNSWKADDEKAEFASTDRFYQLGDTYYGGTYNTAGVTLYDLALAVLADAGIEDSRKYAIDSYLKKITVYNPIPVVTHAEALQIIANAGRCVLYEDRENKIHMKSSFVPDMQATSDDQTDYSNLDAVLSDSAKKAYAVTSRDFTMLDGSMCFIPEDSSEYLANTGYVSESLSDSAGKFAIDPKITVTLESGFVAYGLSIKFRSVAPDEFQIITYYEGAEKQNITVQNGGSLNYITEERFDTFDKLEIIFTKNQPNSRIFIDNILIGDVTNYTIKRDALSTTPSGERQQKVKHIVVTRTNYRESEEAIKELVSENVSVSDLAADNEYTVYFTIPSYGFTASVAENENVTAEIIESSSYFAKVKLTGITTETAISLVVSGYEYAATETYYKVQHNANGQEISWSNPLISTVEQARDLEEWLATYYLGDVDYELSLIQGDPRIEANDLFYLELKDREDALIRAYENELEFSGAWKGTMKARKVAVKWQQRS